MRDAGGWVEGVFDLLADDVAPTVDAVCVDVLQDVDAVPGSGGDFGRRAGCAQPQGQGGMPQVVGSARTLAAGWCCLGSKSGHRWLTSGSACSSGLAADSIT